jgi:predicted transposase/invertase (TIGR01784 family)
MNTTEQRTLVSFDWAMKNILREKANFDVLEGFLTTLLGEEIRILSLLESEANQQYDFDKYNRVDLLAVDANETILVIEIQYAWQPSYLKRLLYSTAKLVVEHIKLGQSYDNVRKVISISIVYFPFTPQDGDYLYHGKTNFFGMNNGKQLQVNMAKLPKPTAIASNATEDDSDVNIFPEYYLFEVDHFQNVIQHPIDEWVYLFKNSAVRADFHSRNIQAAKEKLDLLQMDEKERHAYESFLLSRANAIDAMDGHYQLGRTEEKRENAYKMRQEGLALNLIAKITGLTEAEIAGLNGVHESNHFVNGQNLKTE